MRILTDFAGLWRFDRHILHKDGTQASVTGEARFAPCPAGLEHVETGDMVLNGTRLATTRRYLWQDGLHVLFADGRPFHSVPPMGGSAGHWCDPDQYDVAYDFGDWPVWHSTWEVRGPRKDYRMQTRYWRQS